MASETRRIELCDLSDPMERSVCLEIVGRSLRNSEWTLTGGGRSAQFLDIDADLFDRKAAEDLVSLLTRRIEQFRADGFAFDKVALIDKGGKGPVGLISVFDSLAKAMRGVDFLIVRPKRHLDRSAVKGPFKSGDRILLLSDVATVGWTIFEAASRLRAVGGIVPYALVVIDRYQGALDNLARKGIQLVSLMSLKRLKDEGTFQEIEKKFERRIEEAFEPQLVDFGGPSYTIMG